MSTLSKHDPAKLKSDFDREGYVVLRGFLSPAEVEQVTRNLDRFVRDVIPTFPPDQVYYEDKNRPETLKQFGHMTERDAFFHGMFEGGDFRRLADILLGGECLSKNLQWFNKPPRVGKATPPHQDGYYFMLEPNEAVTMWLALDPVDANNGCMRYIPGSHRKGVRPHARTGTLGFSQGIENYGSADLEREVAVPAAPGDMLAHHSLTIHRADANHSDRHRRALGQVFYASWAKQDAAAHKAYQEKLSRELAAAGKI